MIDDEGSKAIGEPHQAASLESTGAKIRAKAAALTSDAASVAGKAATLVGDLNGDGKVDEADAKIAREYAAEAVSVTTSEAGKLAKSVIRAPLTKDVATYAAVGAAISLPLPVVGPAIGAAVGAGLGLWRNMTRHETLASPSHEAASAPKDPITELERLHSLKERGIITEEEFLFQKRKLLK